MSESAHTAKASEILYFKTEGRTSAGCQLKNFIHFLTSRGTRRPFKFSYVESDGQLMNNLTLKENILLEAVPSSLHTPKEFRLATYLADNGNVALSKLYSMIDDLELRPSEVLPRNRKIASLIKAFVQSTDYLFLERPEEHLDEKTWVIFLEALEQRLKRQSSLVLVSSEQDLLWGPHIDGIVTRGAHFEFEVTPVLRRRLKQKFLNPTPEEEGHMVFAMPEKKLGT